LIQPGAVIGSDGFGFARDGEHWLRIPQIGRVRIGDDVEIGANTTIDRGSLGDTWIADGAILDNLIQIGHNVQIGEYTAVVACTGISGSTKIGKNCLLGGDVGIAGHLEIGDGVCLAAGSRVTRNLHGPGHYGGVLPVDPEPLWRRNVARLRHLDELARRVRQLEQQVQNAPWNGRSDEIHDDATPDI
jgi:UDP-3-O-[3-hydroxymyristoyl] glucosamine N-acyltransferase